MILKKADGVEKTFSQEEKGKLQRTDEAAGTREIPILKRILAWGKKREKKKVLFGKRVIWGPSLQGVGVAGSTR